MAVYGQKSWLKYCECFSVLFALIGRFAPIQFSPDGRRITLQLHGVGLLKIAQPPMSLVFLVIVLLAGLTFDGVMATDEWLKIKTTLLRIEALNGILKLIHSYFEIAPSLIVTDFLKPNGSPIAETINTLQPSTDFNLTGDKGEIEVLTKEQKIGIPVS